MINEGNPHYFLTVFQISRPKKIKPTPNSPPVITHRKLLQSIVEISPITTDASSDIGGTKP